MGAAVGSSSVGTCGSSRGHGTAALVAVVVVLVCALAGGRGAVAGSEPCPLENEVACENPKPGTRRASGTSPAPATRRSRGSPPTSASTRARRSRSRSRPTRPTYRIDIYRLGYYGGDGARKVATIDAVRVAAAGPAGLPRRDAATGLVDCGNWAVSASWTVPADAVSGVYFASLVRDRHRRRQPHRSSSSATTTATPTSSSRPRTRPGRPTTATAATASTSGAPGRAAPTRSATTARSRRAAYDDHGFLFNAEYPMIRWLERNGYDVSYSTGVDTDRRGAELLEHKVFLSVGHDEYWSGEQRANVEAARDAGVNLAFFSGNEVFWKTRWEPSIDGIGDRRTARWSRYKETHADAKIDPQPDVDRHLARPALQPAGRRRPARERADRHDLHGQRATATTRSRVPAAVRQAALLAQHERRHARAGPDRDAARRHARLRVGRGRRQRLPPGRASSGCRRRRVDVPTS